MYSVMDFHLRGRIAPFGHLRFTVCLVTPRSLSHPTTSFIARLNQGIHYTPYVTSFFYFTKNPSSRIGGQKKHWPQTPARHRRETMSVHVFVHLTLLFKWNCLTYLLLSPDGTLRSLRSGRLRSSKIICNCESSQILRKQVNSTHHVSAQFFKKILHK